MTMEIEQRTYRVASKPVVKFPERRIDIVVIPYETEALVEHKGRLIREIVSRGAFGDIDAKRRGKVKVNRGHVIDAVVGSAAALDPKREEGLVAELDISETDLGNETLQLTADGLLAASAGFGVMSGGESWPERGLRRLSRLWLDHIALTPAPAYAGTDALDVRQFTPVAVTAERPNLDVVRGWKLADRFALIE